MIVKIAILLEVYKLIFLIRQKAKQKIFLLRLRTRQMHCEFMKTTMHFKMNLEIYQTSFVMKEVLLELILTTNFIKVFNKPISTRVLR